LGCLKAGETAEAGVVHADGEKPGELACDEGVDERSASARRHASEQ
jgi:hypothetical protein